MTALTVDPETDGAFVAVEDGENVEIAKATTDGIEVSPVNDVVCCADKSIDPYTPRGIWGITAYTVTQISP